ncbi:hypothetical protein [Wenyingzhuangia sp. IMCC45467]
MKKITLGLMTLLTGSLFAQISQGDIAFVGYNSDGDDDFAIVALTDIPSNSTIYFTDSEPNAAGTGMNDEAEGVVTWSTGASVINAGTVVVFTDVDSESNPSFGVSVGVISRSTGFSFAATGEELFATLGNPANNEVTVWLTGIEVHDDGRPENFSTTGLTPGTDYFVMDRFASVDACKYTGTRVNKTVNEYKSLINVDHADNWTYHNSDGETLLPFDTTAFTFTTLSTSTQVLEGLLLSVNNGKIRSNIGEIISVYNVLGREVVNQNLSKGLYVVVVKKGAVEANYKIAF